MTTRHDSFLVKKSLFRPILCGYFPPLSLEGPPVRPPQILLDLVSGPGFVFRDILQFMGPCPSSYLSVQTPWDYSKKKQKVKVVRSALLHHVHPVK